MYNTKTCALGSQWHSQSHLGIVILKYLQAWGDIFVFAPGRARMDLELSFRGHHMSVTHQTLNM